MTYIGEFAFIDSNENYAPRPSSIVTMTSLTIPGSVTHIGVEAFESLVRTGSIDGYHRFKGKLENLTVEEGVISIGDEAFLCNKLTKVVLPDSVIFVGDLAFRNNSVEMDTSDMVSSKNGITSITLGSGVQLGWGSNPADPFGNDFMPFYNDNGKKAGTYTYANGAWTFTARRSPGR